MKNFLQILILSTILLFAVSGFAMDASLGQSAAKNGQRASLEKSFQLYQSKCTACHEGVADPDKPGKTCDDWHIVIKLMHDYGLELTEEEETILVDYFFTIRKGVEAQAG